MDRTALIWISEADPVARYSIRRDVMRVGDGDEGIGLPGARDESEALKVIYRRLTGGRVYR